MNHKWENNKCVRCGIVRTEIKNIDDENDGRTVYQYSDNGKKWVIKRPDCYEPKESQLLNRVDKSKSFSIKDIINEEKKKPIKNYKQDYSELLRSPKWQRKRLEIMQRDDWRCRSCTDDSNELHVHHFQYTTPMPWDEPSENLVTLCTTCHKALHYLLSCPDIGMETFSLLMRFVDEDELQAIRGCSETYNSKAPFD